MRLLLLVALALQACATVAPPAEPTSLASEAEQRQRLYVELVERGAAPAEAREALAAAYGDTPLSGHVASLTWADSLLALPPSSLSEADANWLMVHLAERGLAAQEIERARAARRYSRTWTILATAGWTVGTLTAVGLLLYLTE